MLMLQGRHVDLVGGRLDEDDGSQLERDALIER